MLKKTLRSFLATSRIFKYKITYYLGACLEYYYYYCIRGLDTPASRLSHYRSQVSESSLIRHRRRLALFVAYHPNKPVPLCNLKYLESLSSLGFGIIYIHNGPLLDGSIESLSNLCDKVFCRLNIGQDFGGWKDAYLFLRDQGVLSDVEWLLFCNDSNFYLGGAQGRRFEHEFGKELDRSSVDLVALNKNYELWQHYQSFFLCFRRPLWQGLKFNAFWETYRPLSHRYHAINNGEIKLTRTVLSGISARIIYDSTALWHALQDSEINMNEFYSFLPQNAMYLSRNGGDVAELTSFRIQQMMALLDCHNPSHAYALLFVRYLGSPFLKRDLLRQGVCSLPQIAALLEYLEYDIDSELWREVVGAFELAGRHTSFIRYPKDAFHKGINPLEGAVFNGYGNSLVSYGIRS